MLLAISSIGAAPADSQPAASESTKVELIFWEKQDWEPNGSSERLTLWADGRSEVTVRQWGVPQKPRAGWVAKQEGRWTYYRKSEVFPPEEARKKLNAAVVAGIGELRTFQPGYSDGSGTLAGVQIGGKLTQTIIPMFLHPEEKDNQGSENHKRFLSVEQAIGAFDTDAIEGPHVKGDK
jgi:hypothetical protein